MSNSSRIITIIHKISGCSAGDFRVVVDAAMLTSFLIEAHLDLAASHVADASSSIMLVFAVICNHQIHIPRKEQREVITSLEQTRSAANP